MLKSFQLFSPIFVEHFRVLSCCFTSTHRLLHNGEVTGQIDGEETKEQFNGPIPIECLNIKYSRSPGPGGQNVNKVNTKVDIRFHVMSAQWIPYWIREKLLQEESSRINKDGELIIQSSRFRNQQKNLMDGIEKIQAVLKNISVIPKETDEEKKAKITEMIKSNHERRLKEKKLRSQRKQERSRNE